MPTEQSDNTRVEQPIKLQLPPPEVIEQLTRLRLQKEMQPDQLYDTQKSKQYENMQNAINTNALFGYGLTGRQINYNPNTSQGQAAIQSNFDYTNANAKNFAEQLALAGVAEGVGQVVKATTIPIKVGEGAESAVEAPKWSLQVRKFSTIPRSEAHGVNQVPTFAKLNSKGKTSTGLNEYTQIRVKPASSPKEVEKASKEVSKAMKKKGFKKETHQNLQGDAYSKNGYVYSDIQYGRDWLGRWRIFDLVRETVPEFKLAMQKKGGTLVNTN